MGMSAVLAVRRGPCRRSAPRVEQRPGADSGQAGAPRCQAVRAQQEAGLTRILGPVQAPLHVPAHQHPSPASGRASASGSQRRAGGHRPVSGPLRHCRRGPRAMATRSEERNERTLRSCLC